MAKTQADGKDKDENNHINRRDLLRGGAMVAGGLAAAIGAAVVSRKSTQSDEPTGEETIRRIPKIPESLLVDNADPLLRMQDELRRAMAKPVEQRRWIMVIDLRKCVGCHACTIACVAENKLPPGVVYRQVVEEEIGQYPNVTRRFIPRPCLHCAKPPCVPVCPVSATYTRPDGTVVMDYDRCIGCRYCMNACPYNSRYFDFGFSQYDKTPKENEVVLGTGGSVLEEVPSFEYGEPRQRKREKSPIGNVRKCHFCLHRLEAGELPACTTTCIGRSTYFGDGNDPTSLVSELIAKPNIMRLREELGTEPMVYYLT